MYELPVVVFERKGGLYDIVTAFGEVPQLIVTGVKNKDRDIEKIVNAYRDGVNSSETREKFLSYLADKCTATSKMLHEKYTAWNKGFVVASPTDETEFIPDIEQQPGDTPLHYRVYEAKVGKLAQSEMPDGVDYLAIFGTMRGHMTHGEHEMSQESAKALLKVVEGAVADRRAYQRGTPESKARIARETARLK